MVQLPRHHSAAFRFVRLLGRAATLTVRGSGSAERAGSIDRNDLAGTQQEVQMFAAAVVHELRTPLSALSGEVELALRRERSPAAYREALARIADRVAELVDLTGDLAVVGQASNSGTCASLTANLGAAFASLARRYGTTSEVELVIDADTSAGLVVGDEQRLSRALTLLVEHAVKYRRDRERVRLRAVRAFDASSPEGGVDLFLGAGPMGFQPQTWYHFTASGADHGGVDAPGWLRLRTAARLVQDCGGSWDLKNDGGHDAVRIRLRLARL